MRLRACIALFLLVSACATPAPNPGGFADRKPGLANLQRAAKLPWTDGGQCAVREASGSWPVLVERCFEAMDHDRLEFHDPTGRCAVASMGGAGAGLGVCILAAPEFAAGAVIITGVVLVGFALKKTLDAYELKRDYPETNPTPETRPVPETTPTPLEPLPEQRSKPEPKGPGFPPLGPTETSERERRDKCEPIPVPHLGGNALHNQCADNLPNNSFPGWDVFVNGKNFDALQLTTRTLWEVKTDNFDTYTVDLKSIVVRSQVPKIQSERELARACGFDFKVGVRSAAHKAALLKQDRTLDIVVMEWC